MGKKITLLVFPFLASYLKNCSFWRIAASCPRVQESEVISVLLNWAMMNSDQLFTASEVISCATRVLSGTKMAAGGFWKARCPSFFILESFKDTSVKLVEEVCRLAHCSVFQKFVSSPAKGKAGWAVVCIAHWVTSGRLDHTWQMTVIACNSAEGQQSEAAISEPLFTGLVIGHDDFIVMAEGSEINLFTGFKLANKTNRCGLEECIIWNLDPLYTHLH